MPVLEITQAADVGMGSLYNHFDSKEQLFEAAVADVLDTHGALLDQVTAPLDDPAEKFACSFRLTGRLFRRRPQESLVLLSHGLTLISSDRGLAPRALRDIKAAEAGGSASTTPNWRWPLPVARSWDWASSCRANRRGTTPSPLTN